MMQNNFYQHINTKERHGVNDIMHKFIDTESVNFHSHFYKIISAF
jgi:hypothetical protein